MKTVGIQGETHSLSFKESLEYLTATGERLEELNKKLNTKRVENLRVYERYRCGTFK